jgi:ribosomal protein L40E
MKYIKHFQVFENQKFCTKCGAKLDLKSKFCTKCGVKQSMMNRPKSDDEKSVLAKLNDNKVDLKEKISLIISIYEGDLIQHMDLDKKAFDILDEYQKRYGFNDESYKKAIKLQKKSMLIGTIEQYKSKSQDPEYRKSLDSIIHQFHDKDVDDYDDSSIMIKSLLFDQARFSSSKEKGKLWKDLYMKLANSYQKDSKGNNGQKLFGQMLMLDIMVSRASKYPDHKVEFDKIFQEYLKDENGSELLKKTYAKESEIKKQKSGVTNHRFDSSGKEVKDDYKGITFDSSGKEIKI